MERILLASIIQKHQKEDGRRIRGILLIKVCNYCVHVKYFTLIISIFFIRNVSQVSHVRVRSAVRHLVEINNLFVYGCSSVLQSVIES